jgi:hypothetical protein
MNGSAFQYTGYVESINIKGVGPNSDQFLFSLISLDGSKHWSFVLDAASEPQRYAAMASLLTAAFAGDKIVSLNTSTLSSQARGGVAIACEIQVVRAVSGQK